MSVRRIGSGLRERVADENALDRLSVLQILCVENLAASTLGGAQDKAVVKGEAV